MSHLQNFHEARADYIAKFGQTAGPTFHQLLTDYWELRFEWAEYVDLFGTSKKRIALLNEAGGRLFRVVQDRLWESVLLHLCRLNDPPTQGKHRNLSLGALQEALERDGHSLPGLPALIKKASAAAAFARRPRNTRIGHRSLPHALGEMKAVTLGSRKQVRVTS